jgi:hypothetical protein
VLVAAATLAKEPIKAMLTNEEARLAEVSIQVHTLHIRLHRATASPIVPLLPCLQPESVEDSQLEAWRMDDSDADQRCEHRHALALHHAGNYQRSHGISDCLVTFASSAGRSMSATEVKAFGGAIGLNRGQPQASCDACCDRRTPNEPVSVADLRRLGVLSWHLNSSDGLEDDPQLAAIRKARGYSYQVRAGAG